MNMALKRRRGAMNFMDEARTASPLGFILMLSSHIDFNSIFLLPTHDLVLVRSDTDGFLLFSDALFFNGCTSLY